MLNQIFHLFIQTIFKIQVNIWTNFAECGNPNYEPYGWEPVTDETVDYKCLNIGNELSVIDLPEANRMEFWDNLYDEDQLI